MPDDWLIDDDFNLDDLEDWIPWGDYPEPDNKPDTDSADQNTNPGFVIFYNFLDTRVLIFRNNSGQNSEKCQM